MSNLVARSASPTHPCQKYEDHVSGVMSISRHMAERVSLRLGKHRNDFLETIRLAAEFHDLGKIHPHNQTALVANNLKKLPYQHWIDGANYLARTERSSDPAMLVLAHHSCLDKLALKETVTKMDSSFPFLHQHKSALNDNKSQNPEKMDTQMFLRMGLSCLVNGDWDDSAKAKGNQVPECIPVRWEERLSILQKNVEAVTAKKTDEIGNLHSGQLKTFQVNRHALRQRLWKEIGNVSLDQDISVLSATVGMGKTFSFLRLALRQAIEQKAPHIFIIAPFNHIVDQLVSVLRKNLVLDGEDPEEVVGNHTCIAEYKDNQIQNSVTRWRCPIIVTSSVQFFETMSSNVAGKLVKLVEVPGSIVVVDEWHSVIPENLVSFYWEEIGNISKYFNTKFILSSGSMTRYWDDGLYGKFVKDNGLKIKDVVSKQFMQDSVDSEKDRVKYLCLGNMSADELASDVLNYGGKGKKTIVLVSTTKNVAVMANRLIGKGRNVYTVYGSLIDADSSANVEKIRGDNTDWITVCTTSIESGIDISAETAYSVNRSIMSQIQLGGRVNREGNYPGAMVYIFTETTGDFNSNSSFYEPARISESLIPLIHDAESCSASYLKAYHLQYKTELEKAVIGNLYPEIAKESRIINEGRGNVLVGPKAKDIYDRLVKKANGEKVSVSMKEISQNSVPTPTISKNGSSGFSESEFIQVPGFETEDGKSLLLYYDGGYDPDIFGIWRDKSYLL